MIFTSRRTVLVVALFITALFLVVGLIVSGAIPDLRDGIAQVSGSLKTGKDLSKAEQEVSNGETEAVTARGPMTVEGEKTSSEDFFANYRLDRERVRGHQVELLQEVVNDPNSDAATRKEAQDKLIQISESMDKELQLEALIKAKGFKEAALFIQPDSATAILEKENMAESDVTVVADMISRVTGHNLEDIVVIPK